MIQLFYFILLHVLLQKIKTIRRLGQYYFMSSINKWRCLRGYGTEIVSMAIVNAIDCTYTFSHSNMRQYTFSLSLSFLFALRLLFFPTHADYFNNLRKYGGAVTLKLVQLCKIFCSSLFCITFSFFFSSVLYSSVQFSLVQLHCIVCMLYRGN